MPLGTTPPQVGGQSPTPQTSGSGHNTGVYAPSSHHGWSDFSNTFNHAFVHSLRRSSATTNRVLSGLLGFRRGG